MKFLGKACLSILLVLALCISPYAKATYAHAAVNPNLVIVTPMYIPLEVSISTNKSSYDINEVVETIAYISGGIHSLTDVPTYTVTYADSTGYSYTLETTDSKVTFNKAYTKTGTYSVTVTVISNKAPNEAYDYTSFVVVQ